ncbi:hypothetical protein PAP_09630 [Palaeococcus pacificus DY20341]|uniref:Uncharacterized protein n=1 Tax=Palaeococcus pacificus DY20341 TaxID=1343739 RepID=A0A075LVT8_9EURY|nr:hypothetical protein [Palaeococcus pacificus]AIF70301.1 hypothetical protein PAP_09630 [Palaeococcus pacificus DY20341]
MFSFLRRKKEEEKAGITVYMSEPTLLYNTKTEKDCIGIIEKHLAPGKIIVPSKYGLRPTEHLIDESDVFVAIAIVGKLTSGVVREIERAQSLKKKIYTLEIARKGDHLEYALIEDVPDELEKLSPEQTKEFYDEFRVEDLPKLSDLFFGSRKSGW